MAARLNEVFARTDGTRPALLPASQRVCSPRVEATWTELAAECAPLATLRVCHAQRNAGCGVLATSKLESTTLCCQQSARLHHAAEDAGGARSKFAGSVLYDAMAPCSTPAEQRSQKWKVGSHWWYRRRLAPTSTGRACRQVGFGDNGK